jgi:cell division protein FtsX
MFLVVNFGYVYLALRRVYGQGRGITAVKLSALVVLNLIAAIIGTAGAMIYALFS